MNARLLRRGLLDNGYSELPIGSEHAVAIDSLPPIHKNPFDRILVALPDTRIAPGRSRDGVITRLAVRSGGVQIKV